MRANSTASHVARFSALPRERGEHAKMLEHAAMRRRRGGVGGDDAAYWRACAPAAVARAAAVRRRVGFAAIP